MKVTFLIPPALDGTQGVDRCFGCNYGIYFLPLLPVLNSATIVKEEAEDVSILDFAAKKAKEKEFRDFILNDSSDVYVFYTVFLSQNTDLIARGIIREANKKAVFIFFGPQATYAPQSFLDKQDTFAVRGEPEFIIKDLIRAIKDRSGLGAITGLSYLSGSGVVHNPPRDIIADIDSIPIPDRRLLDHTPYFNPKLHHLPHTAALTSRGCFGKCWFCVPNSLSYARELEFKKGHARKPPPRLHSVKRVIEEFTRIKELGFRSVSVIDDEFIWDEKRTVEICEGIKHLKLEWSCLSRPDMINESIVQAMAAAGCSYIDLGTESFDQGVLDAIGKDMRPEDTRRAVRIIKQYGIEPEINVLLGATPQETVFTIKKTLKEVRKLGIRYVLFSIANPFPGTDFYEAAKRNGWLVYGEYRPVEPAREAIISYPHLSKRKLEQLISYAYLTHYFNPGYLIRELLSLKNFRDFRIKFNTGINLIKRNFLK